MRYNSQGQKEDCRILDEISDILKMPWHYWETIEALLSLTEIWKEMEDE